MPELRSLSLSFGGRLTIMRVHELCIVQNRSGLVIDLLLFFLALFILGAFLARIPSGQSAFLHYTGLVLLVLSAPFTLSGLWTLARLPSRRRRLLQKKSSDTRKQ